MKSKKSLFKKFHRKYAFLQTSLFDFLLWRKSNFNLTEKNSGAGNFQKKKIQPGVLDREKISLQEYWKNSENKKIQNTLQNINREFLNQQNVKKSRLEFSKTQVRAKIDKKKLQKIFTKTNSPKFKFQSFYLINFQTNLSSRTSSRFRHSRNKTFLPQTDSFVQGNLSSPFRKLKIGQFFPMKQHFQQYWIFPLLGFVFFFSSSFEKKTNEKFHGQPNSFLFSSFQNKATPDKELSFFKQSFPSQLQKPKQTFSFSPKEVRTAFLENEEFTEVANFYLKFLCTSLSSGFSESVDSQIFQRYLEKTSLQGKKLKTVLRQKRNTFEWTWFSVNPHFFSRFQKNEFSRKQLQIPQKGQFFSSKNPEKFLFFSQKNSNMDKKTPIFEFSNLHFFFNDFERNLTIPNSLLKFEKTPFSFENSAGSEAKGDNFGISPFELKNFVTSFENDDIQSFNALFSKKTKNGDSQQLQLSSKTFFFLEKWFETQKIWQVQKKEKTHDFQKGKPSNFGEGFPSKTRNFSPSLLQKIHSPYFMNLDSLYLQKYLQSFVFSQKGSEKKMNKTSTLNFEIQKQVEILKRFQNLSPFFQFKKEEKTFQNKQKKNVNSFFSNQTNFSFSLKKQSFEFSLFQYYKKESQNFLKSGFLKTKTFENSSIQKLLFPFFEKKVLFSTKQPSSLFQTKIAQNLYFSSFSRVLPKNGKDILASSSQKTMAMAQVKMPEVLKSEEKSQLLSSPFIRFEIPLLLDSGNEQNTLFAERHLLSSKKHEFWKKPSFVFGSSFVEPSQNAFSSKYFGFEPSLEIFSNFSNSTRSRNFPQISDSWFAQLFNNSLQKPSFVFSFKNSLFETFLEKVLKKVKTNFFFHEAKFFFFEKAFFFENLKKEKPFVFHQNSNNFLYFFENSTKVAQFERKNFPWKKWTKSFLFQQTPQSFLSSSLNNSKKVDSQKYKSSFFNFQSRKFEKLFHAFLSPLNKEKNFLSGKTKNVQGQEIVHSSAVFKLKTEKDLFLLQNLSSRLQKLFKNSTNHSLFFSQKTRGKNLSVGHVAKLKNQSERASVNFSKKTKEPQIFSESFLSPTTLFKRDGFLRFSKSKNFGTSKALTKSLPKSFFERLEKEKSLQKKRRLKKQKLETRRRKKRKRFFPRPVWLRFHLYKKFLKSRHPQKHFSSFFLHTKSCQPFSFQSLPNGKTNLQIVPRFSKKSPKYGVTPFSSFQEIHPTFFFNAQQNNRWKNVFFQSFDSKKMWKKTHQFRFSRFVFEQKKNLSFENFELPFFHSFSNEPSSRTSLQASKFYFKNTEKWNLYWKNGFFDKTFSSQIQGNITFRQKPASFSGFQKSPISLNSEDYKISGEILSEFLRLSWKSYWFQTNFQPYTQRITKNFQQIKKRESQKALSEYSIFDCFGKSQALHLFENFPIFQTTQPDCSQNDFLFQKAIFQKFLWYFNLRNSFESSPPVRSSFLQSSSAAFNFQNIQNFPEYNRIVSARISEVFKSFKSAETNEDYVQRDLSKTGKFPKRKNEPVSGNLSFFTKSALFSENFTIPSQPILPAFSLFSSLFQNTSLKPTGDLPTLRALWALQKTNFSQFQETNAVRNLWTLKKRTESLKALKGTKKIVGFFRKYTGLEKLNAPALLNTLEGPSQIFFQERNERTSLSSSSFLLKKKLFVFSKVKGNLSAFLQDLDHRSLQKFQTVQQKCSLFGVHTLQQNSKISLRYLKFHLLTKSSQYQMSTVVPVGKNTSAFSKRKQFDSKKNFQKFHHLTSTMKPLPQNSAKSSLNFWWAQQNFQTLEFFNTVQTKTLNSFQFFPFSKTSFDNNSEGNTFVYGKRESNSHLSGVKTQFFVFGAIIFHLALIFTLLKLPEIRSVVKFQCLVLLKFFHGFFVLLFSISDFVKKYTVQGKYIVQKLQKVTFFSQPVHFLSFDSSFAKTGAFENFLFSRTNFLDDKNFKNLLRPSRFSFDQAFSQFSNMKKTSNFNLLHSNFSLKKSPSFFFEIFVRLSEFSNQFSAQNQSFSFDDKKIYSFFLPQKKLVYSFSRHSSQKTQVKRQSSFTKFCTFPQPHFSFENSKPFFVSQLPSKPLNVQLLTMVFPREKFLSNCALSVLFFGKSLTFLGYSSLQLSSTISAKVLDVFEMVFFSVYKFLEKPAELMIEWIALIFLIEWSSDIVTFLPDTVDISFAKSSYKFGRPLRPGSLFFSLFHSKSAHFQSAVVSLQNSLPGTFVNSVEFFTYSNMLSFVFQKRFFYFGEHFFSVLLQPDMDILVRQKKGMIFWDIWAEILLKAAEKYNVNIPSFVTLKEEQELFLEKLLQDRQFFQSLEVEKQASVFFRVFKKEENKDIFNSEILQQMSLYAFLRNFFPKEHPSSLPDLGFAFSQREIAQVALFKKVDLFQDHTDDSFSNQAVFQKMTSIFQKIDSKNQVPHFHNFFQNKLCGQKNFEFSSNFFDTSFFPTLDRWSCSQYGTYQGPETDLFVELSPPKSFKHIQFLKYYEPAQYTVGSLVCQVYSGVFSKQVSKNILVLGAAGTAKTLFLQALAGETEMKIITDNAYRYSIVQRGVAVGMKYLRDVFDALALQTPCFFLMEHIHVIGSKRPLLISDDENVKGLQSSFGLDQQEVHETNQMIYQLNRHAISDYKRPYKGDFSMAIPTNFFLQHFYSKFEKTSTSIFQNSQFSSGGINFVERISPVSPLPIEAIEHSLAQQGFAEKEKTDTAFQNSFASFASKTGLFRFQSRLQIGRAQVFAPPATSPFTILMMKQQKQLKPKKIVQESSWGGFSTDQLVSSQKENSSVRAKVAVLADITMNLSRGKLDMITDLLVIIDSVRSNRGFVVFATTHLPALLDPALRRPGRFDETISLAQSPNFFTRFELFKMHFENSLTTLDFLDLSLFTENLSELNLLNMITSTKLSLFHQYTYTTFQSFDNLKKDHSSPKRKAQKRQLSEISPAKAFQKLLKSSFFQDLYSQKQISSPKNFQKTNISKYFLRDFQFSRYSFVPKKSSHELSLASTRIGLFLAKSNFLQEPTAFLPLTFDRNEIFSNSSQSHQFFGSIFYGSENQQKLQLMTFFSGKVSEFFFQKTSKISMPRTSMPIQNQIFFPFILSTSDFFDTPGKFFEKKFSFFCFEENDVQLNFFENKRSLGAREISLHQQTDFFWTTFGNDTLWRSATPFLFSIIQKRFFFTKNLLLSKMLFFENKNSRKLPPSPPNSSIFMPTKKYENFKRTEQDFVQKLRFSIHEKIQLHQQQRFLKQLYNIPIQQHFRSELLPNRTTFFSSSFQELGYLDSFTQSSSSSHYFQKKYLGIRHRFSSLNQWWNGFLPEHNTETTFLSDVDWRTVFQTTSAKTSVTSKMQNFSSQSGSTQTFEYTMDFPDTEQYYNPRNRRWFFHGKVEKNSSKTGFFWLNFDTTLQYEIYYHYFMQSFHESFQYFDTNREMLDYFVFLLLQKGFLKEFHYLTTLSRFQSRNF